MVTLGVTVHFFVPGVALISGITAPSADPGVYAIATVYTARAAIIKLSTASLNDIDHIPESRHSCLQFSYHFDSKKIQGSFNHI